MAFDGITTMAIVRELNNKILYGKIEKIYQPEREEIVLLIHTTHGNRRLLISSNSNASRMHFIDALPTNPANPPTFCMLMRKHLQGGRIVTIEQVGSERIVEISFEALNELGFTVSKKLIIEIMGKHSNITLVDLNTNKIIDSIKRISIDVNRVRQILPGKVYEYPPRQDKIPFKECSSSFLEELSQTAVSGKSYLDKISGISLSIANGMYESDNSLAFLNGIIDKTNTFKIEPRIYFDEADTPKEFSIVPLDDYEAHYKTKVFEDLSDCLDYYYEHKTSSNRIHQKSHDLIKNVNNLLTKSLKKKQKLNEDLENAKNSENLRLYGELLMANLHAIKSGDKSASLTNYYDNTTVNIPLDERFSPSKNAQIYFKKYAKSKTALKEKRLQLTEVASDIAYLESVLSFLENSQSSEDIESIKLELIETGYIKRRSNKVKEKKIKSNPKKYTLTNGMEVLVGRNNKENDMLTLKTATKQDIWFHTKDIPGSHVILRTNNISLNEIDAGIIYDVAAIAAYHSKGQNSSNVPVDYVPVRYVKKPNGAKPGMVIFTNNKTVWVNPKLP